MCLLLIKFFFATSFTYGYFFSVRGLAIPQLQKSSNVMSATADSTSTAVTPIKQKNPKQAATEEFSMTCGLMHLVFKWVDIATNDRVSVVMTLPSGIDATNPNMFHYQVSDDGYWLVVKVKYDFTMMDVYQCYHAHLTQGKNPVSEEALDYHSKIAAHKKVVALLQEKAASDTLWKEHRIFLGAKCNHHLPGIGDGDHIFYGATCLAPRKNGARFFHVELMVSSPRKRVIKRAKVAQSSESYQPKSRLTGDDMAEKETLEENAQKTRRYAEMEDAYNAQDNAQAGTGNI